MNGVAAAVTLRDEAKNSPQGVHNHPVSRVLPFFEHMGTWPTKGTQKEFWWEREWRRRGDFVFEMNQVALWIVPEAAQATFKAALKLMDPTAPTRCIDAYWGMEEIIARLTDQTPTSPFSA